MQPWAQYLDAFDSLAPPSRYAQIEDDDPHLRERTHSVAAPKPNSWNHDDKQLVNSTDMGRKDQKRHHLIIGLDFGTTHTGVAYALSGHQRIFTVNKWPGPEPGSWETGKQVPSIFAYDQHENPYWGYQVKPEMTNRYSFMKLHLDKNAPSTDYNRAKHGEELQNGYFRIPESKKIEHVTREYLISVLAYTKRVLEDKFGKFFTNSTRVEFWLTKPVASGDQAQHAVAKLAKEAAVRAGFAEDVAKAAGFADNGAENFFGLVEESVAALTANLLETDVSDDYTVESGDKILVCDCGGGQVDIGVYTLVNRKNTFEFEQVTVAQGPKVGAAHIDRKLHELMAEANPEFMKLGPEKEVGSKFMQDFENQKREFGKPSSKRITLRLDMKDGERSQFYRLDGRVILSDEDMKWMFKSTIKQIKEALSAQFNEANKLSGGKIKVLAVVGGLGDSPYLKSTLKAWCDLNKIGLRIPKDSWNAVARGAVAYGLGKSKITKRLTQNHYGIECSLPFDPNLDHESEKIYSSWDTEQKYPLCGNCISWIVEMGKEITDAGSFKTSYYSRDIIRNYRSFTKAVYCSKIKDAPRKIADDTIRTSTISARLTDDDVSTAKRGKLPSGREYLKFDWQMEVLLGEREGTVILQPRSKKAVLGSGVVNVNFTPL